MGIISEFVEVRPTPQTVRHYESLGYTIPKKKSTELTKKTNHKEYVYDFGKKILVRPEHLTKCSTIEVIVLCDMCKENTMSVPYENYNSVVERTGNYVCKECAYKKRRQNVREKYNVDSVSQLEEVKKKARETMMKKYNVEHALQNDTIKNRAMETMRSRYGVEHALQKEEFVKKMNETKAEKYGENFGKIILNKASNTYFNKTGYEYPMQNPDVQNKYKTTMMDRYNVEWASQSKEITAKMCKNNFNKYGYEYTLQLPEIRQKMNETLCKNGIVKTSRQQIYIYNLYNYNQDAF